MHSAKILVINPNSTSRMTQNLADTMTPTNLDVTFMTAPSGPVSINNDEDGQESLEHCRPLFTDEIIDSYDAFIVACYSIHPLVAHLKSVAEQVRTSTPGSKRSQVIGIFEASVWRSLQLLRSDEMFGIVSTGVYWEEALTKGIANMGNNEITRKFAGVTTTGLSAAELHDRPAEDVKRRMKDATRRLLEKGRIGAICLGCAGMTGLDSMVREACSAELGKENAANVRIIDGVAAALLFVASSV